ncbi:TetR/AcrR family transcriptional regulator [Pseudonocardia sp. KRD291]|uniref:TetR/AcrR family transcriptional regulator n=1 Tax=Pseudonocardia sp. KRD291 TaxID=2792007 RepID=UPI001C4A0937|nr:TetR/AcrR family transcriptional regulator [Pseudonocardia sp. KRD291]MBW0103168.1 TetR/AcrR family transcriptional regulator [Pseudonocardia sp. KRD291]
MTDGDDTTRPRGGRRAEGKARTREAVLSAARSVFAERGYGSASVEEIAREAGVAIGSVYAHFGGKQALFAALIDRTTADGLARAERSLSGGATEALPHLVAQLGEQADDRISSLLEAETWLYAIRNDDPLARHLADDDRRIRDGIARLLAAERPSSENDRFTDAEQATVLNALFHGLIRQRRLCPEAVPDDLFRRAMEVFGRVPDA